MNFKIWAIASVETIGYNLSSHGQGILLSDGDHGLGQPPGDGLASFQHPGRFICTEALEEALDRFGVPEIFNSVQGSQFTSEAFTKVHISNNVRISIGGRGRWIDNVFIERLWRSVKYEEVYLKAYGSISAARREFSNYFERYNMRRRHQGIGRRTPDSVYWATLPGRIAV